MSAIDLAPWREDILAADLADWLTVAAYGVAALLAGRAAGAPRSAQHLRERRFWQLCAILLIALGINELFDFQMLLTALGKVWAQRFGLFEQRRTIQLIFVVVLALATVLAVGGALAATRSTDRAVRAALLGLAMIAAFVLLRAASFHHADAWLGAGPARFNFGAIQEMAGIAIVAAAAWYYRREKKQG